MTTEGSGGSGRRRASRKSEQPAGDAQVTPEEAALADETTPPGEPVLADGASLPAGTSPAGETPFADEPSALAADGTTRRRSPAGPRLAAVLPWALGVLAIALSVAAGLEVAHVRHADSVADARTQSVAAARSAVQGVLSYDYRHLDQDFTAGRKLLTPGFAKDYEETTKAVAPTAKQYHAVVTAEVTAAGARNVSADSATVLLFVDQTSTNTKHAQPRIDQSRVRVTMVKDGGRWLLSKLEAL